MLPSRLKIRPSGVFLSGTLFFGLTATVQAIETTPVNTPPLAPMESFSERKKSVKVADLTRSFKNRIEIKFRENSGIRLRQGRLTVAATAKGAPAAAELRQVLDILDGTSRYLVVRLHELPEADLDAMKSQGEKNTGHQLSDLNLWFYIFVDVASDQELASVINQLNQLDIVEYASASRLPAPPPGMDDGSSIEFEHYWQRHNKVAWPVSAENQMIKSSIPAPALLSPTTHVSPPSSGLKSPAPPVAGNYLASQDYRKKAPVGIDIDYVNNRYFNADGRNWGYTDVEYGWNDTHQDLGQISGDVYVNGLPSSSAMELPNRNHGTAVIGILSSDDNGWGTTGLVPNAAVRLSTHSPSTGYNPANAITSAANQFWKGAVILLEMQEEAAFDCNGADTRESYVPIEWNAASKAAITTAVANGRIVVEAAGNGNCNLNLAGFKGAFNPNDTSKDSGAIIVGAGEKLTRNKADFSTYGSRVDSHAEGDFQIYTTGYGGLYNAEGENFWYTSSFAGTSGASPIVTGAAVALASMLWEYHGSIWAPKELRDLLRREGTAQGTGGHIGPRPNLKKQVEAMTNRHLQMHSADFDGDRKTDYAIFRPSTGYWKIRYATGLTQSIAWGTKGDIPAPADITGDGRAELIVFRPSNGTWYIRSWNPLKVYKPIAWGQNGDLPVPLDYNGDGKAELTVYRRRADGLSQSHWYIRHWGTGAGSTDIIWGEVSDTPIARDMDNDGRDDLVIFRGKTSPSEWWIRYSATDSYVTYTWGQWGDIPLTYRDSLGRWNIAVWRPSDAKFYARNINTGKTAAVQWGQPGDMPRFGDTDGNGADEYIIWRPSTGVWWNRTTNTQVQWGLAGDLAIAR